MTRLLLLFIAPTFDKQAGKWIEAFSEILACPAILFAKWQGERVALPKNLTPALLVDYAAEGEAKLLLQAAREKYLESFGTPPAFHHSFSFQLTRRVHRALENQEIPFDFSIFYPVSPFKPTHNLPLQRKKTLFLPKSYGYLLTALLPPLLPYTHQRKSFYLPVASSILPVYFSTASAFQEALATFSAYPLLTLPIYLPLFLALPQKHQQKCWARWRYLAKAELECGTLEDLHILKKSCAKDSATQNRVPLLFKGIDYPFLFTLYRIARKQISSHEAIAYL